MRRKSAVVAIAIGMFAATSLWAVDTDVRTEFRQAYSEYARLVDEGHYRASLPFAKRGFELGEQLFEPTHENRVALTYNYGWNLVKVKEHQAAKPVLKKALELYEALYGKDSDALIPVLMDLGHAHTLLYDSSQQTKYYRRALRLAAKHSGRDSVAYAQRSLDAGIYILEESRARGAQRYLKDALDILTKELGTEHPRTGVAAFYLGKLNLANKRHGSARDNLLLALKSFERPDEPSNAFEMGTHAFLVQVYEELGESAEATKHCLAIGRMSPARESQDHQPLFRLAPTYPSLQQRRGVEGHVIVEFTIDDSGFVKDAVVDSSTRGGFEKSALAAVEKWRYAPRFENGVAVSTPNIRTRIGFVLED